MTAPTPEAWLLTHDDYLALLGAAMTGEPLPAAEVVAIAIRSHPTTATVDEEANAA
ncbi:MAG TPA: hypothetical protein VGE43_19590 [Acidimicrobiales bacterium]